MRRQRDDFEPNVIERDPESRATSRRRVIETNWHHPNVLVDGAIENSSDAFHARTIVTDIGEVSHGFSMYDPLASDFRSQVGIPQPYVLNSGHAAPQTLSTAFQSTGTTTCRTW